MYNKYNIRILIYIYTSLNGISIHVDLLCASAVETRVAHRHKITTPLIVTVS